LAAHRSLYFQQGKRSNSSVNTRQEHIRADHTVAGTPSVPGVYDPGLFRGIPAGLTSSQSASGLVDFYDHNSAVVNHLLGNYWLRSGLKQPKFGKTLMNSFVGLLSLRRLKKRMVVCDLYQ
jgi:hypothetical protein